MFNTFVIIAIGSACATGSVEHEAVSPMHEKCAQGNIGEEDTEQEYIPTALLQLGVRSSQTMTSQLGTLPNLTCADGKWWLNSVRRILNGHRQCRSQLEVPIHFLHVGKTGGNTVQNALMPVSNCSRISYMSHRAAQDYVESTFVNMSGPGSMLPTSDLVFTVRAPIHRFVSAWISSVSCGSYHGEISFATPNDLACALYSSDAAEQSAARSEIGRIFHTASDLTWYLGGVDTVKAMVDAGSILFVARNEHLDEDLGRLQVLLLEVGALEAMPTLEEEDSKVRSNSSDAYTYLSRCAVQNLRRWYNEDYEIIEHLAASGLIDSSYVSEVEEMDAAPQTDEMISYR